MSFVCSQTGSRYLLKCPKAIGPYSVAYRHRQPGFCQRSARKFDPISGSIVEGGIQAQTRTALTNLKSVLESGRLQP